MLVVQFELINSLRILFKNAHRENLFFASSRDEFNKISAYTCHSRTNNTEIRFHLFIIIKFNQCIVTKFCPTDIIKLKIDSYNIIGYNVLDNSQ